MEEKVFLYLKEHPASSHHKIAQALNMPENNVMCIINSLQKKRMVNMDVLPLGNSIEPDNSCYYTAVGNYSNAFRDIKTAYGLVEYLSDSAARLENSRYIHHYTTLETAIKIIDKKKWHLANPKDMNDQLEYQNGDKLKWETIFLSAFMTENKESIGMWSMYAQPWEKGVKISIPSRIARSWISDIKEVEEVSMQDYSCTGRRYNLAEGEIKLSSVAYTNTDSLSKKEPDETLTWSNQTNTRLHNIAHNIELSGYVKDQAWSYEKEIRIFAEFNNWNNFKRIAIDVPEKVIDSMVITASPLFEGKLMDELRKEIQRQVKTDKSLFEGKLNIMTICSACELKKAKSNT
ncbi:MAG: DUF2971 domain-containing protein [Oscillospiraceae bacterium]|nr:DUF2971 domain-containing protein [Oscillospiraceae bacterium]